MYPYKNLLIVFILMVRFCEIRIFISKVIEGNLKDQISEYIDLTSFGNDMLLKIKLIP